jgi:hypothetical protein
MTAIFIPQRRPWWSGGEGFAVKVSNREVDSRVSRSSRMIGTFESFAVTSKAIPARGPGAPRGAVAVVQPASTIDGRTDMPLTSWPTGVPREWLERVNSVLPKAQHELLQTSMVRGRQFGRQAWVDRTAKRLGLEFNLRPRGQPKTRRQQRDKE